MLDVKKLITGFLVLALGASTAAWILSGANNAASSATIAQTTGASLPSMANSNAFLPTNATPQDVAALLANESLSSSTEAALEQPGNLTGTLGNSLLNNLIAANPNGIQADANNNQEINQPDDNAILSELQSDPTASNIPIPNWDTEAANIPVLTTKSSSETEVANYSGAMDKIFNDSFVRNGVQSMVSDASEADPANINYVQSAVEGALNNISSLEAPSNLISLQKSLIKLLIYEKNVLSLVKNSNTDPIRGSLILQGEQLKYNLALNDFETQFEKAQNVNGFSFEMDSGKSERSGIAWLGSLLGIKIAHAQFLTFDATNFGEWLLKFAYDTALQIAKNMLISFIQHKVLTWIAGNGAPMFVRNWATDMANAGEMSAINAINSNYACVNPNTIFPQIQVILNAIYKPGNNVCEATFQSALSSGDLQQFYNNFSKGGFVTFGETLMPSNDFYGGLFFAAQDAGQAAQQGQSVFTLKTTAQQGFKGTEKCDDGSDPNGITTNCIDDTTGIGTPIEDEPNKSCPDGTTSDSMENNGKCANGADPVTNSPGQVTGQIFSTSLQGSTQLVTAANDITGLLNAAVNSLLSGLANTAINSAGNAINSGLTGSIPQTSSPSSVAPGIPSGHGVTCSPQIWTTTFDPTVGQSSITLYASGGVDATGNAAYTWSAPGSIASSGGTTQGSPFQATYSAAGTYNVTVTASDGSNSSCQVVLATSTTTTLPPSQPSTNTSGVSCSPLNQIVTFARPYSSITLAATSTPTTTPATYTWLAPGSTAAVSINTTTFQVTYSATGTYSIFVTASTGSGTSTCTANLISSGTNIQP